MTSKTLFRNLLKDDLKKKRGLFIVALIVFIFVNPISTLMYGERLLSSSNITSMAELKDFFISHISFAYWGNSILPVMLAVILSVFEFMYLFSKKKTDLYHSLPVKRKTLFFSHYINGLLMFVTIMAVSTLLNVISLGIKGFSGGEIWLTAGLAFLYAVIYFILFYNLCIVAVMLAGNFWISICAIGTFIFYIPLVIEIINGYFSSYMSTYYMTYSSLYSPPVLLSVISPALSLFNVQGSEDYKLVLLIAAVLLSIVFLALAIWLYQKRPSECSGRALSFPKIEAFIRFIIIIPVSLLGGYYVLSLFSGLSPLWFWFAFLSAGILCHCLLEILLHLDFKSIFRHKLQLVFSIAVAALIAICFQYDWMGYDTYLPDADKVEYAAVSLKNIDTNMNGFEFKITESGPDLIYTDKNEYRLKNMKLTNLDDVIALSQIGITQSDELYTDRYQTSANRVIFKGSYNTASMSEDAPIAEFSVRYHLKSGKDVYRNYMANMDDCVDAIAPIYDNPEYKNWSFQADEIYKSGYVKQMEGFNAWDDKIMSVSGSDMDKFFEAYLADLNELSIHALQTEIPIVRLSAVYEEAKLNNYYATFDGYYIYPSFSRTINVMKELGIEESSWDNTIDSEKIVSITSTGYFDDYSKVSNVTYMAENPADKAKITELGQILKIDSLLSNYELYPTESQYSFEIQYILENGIRINTYASIPKGRLPDFVIEDLNKQ